MSEPGRDASGRDPESGGAPPQGFAEAMAHAARQSALGHLRPGEAPTGRALLRAMGGVRGLVESILPGVVFLVVYTVTRSVGVPTAQQVPVSVAAPAVIAVLFVVVRLIQREPVTLAVAGVFGLLVSAVLAIITGSAIRSFLPGFLVDGALALVMIASLVARRPLIGLIVGLLAGDVDGWRTDPAKRRVARITTLLWAAFPLFRLAVQVPLYLAGLTTALGTTKLLMGVPLYAGIVWVTWLLVRSVLTPARDADAEPAERG